LAVEIFSFFLLQEETAQSLDSSAVYGVDWG